MSGTTVFLFPRTWKGRKSECIRLGGAYSSLLLIVHVLQEKVHQGCFSPVRQGSALKATRFPTRAQQFDRRKIQRTKKNLFFAVRYVLVRERDRNSGRRLYYVVEALLTK